MAKVIFKYRSKRDFGSISVRLSHHDFRMSLDFTFSSTYIIPKSMWDFKRKAIKGKSLEAKHHKIRLTELEYRLLDRFQEDYNNQKKIDLAWCKKEIEVFFGRLKNNNKIEFLEYYEKYISKYSKTILPTTGEPLAKTSIRAYTNSLKIIKIFNDEVYNLSFDKITTDFYEDFLNFMYDRNYSVNYIGNQIKTIKTIMNSAYEDDLHNNLDFKKRAFKKISSSAFNIYLNESELLSIHSIDIDSIVLDENKLHKFITKKNMKISRDLFLIGAYTGLRISDFSNIKNKNIALINGHKYLRTNVRKTKGSVTIPLAPIVESILKKYENTEIPSMVDQTLNYAIKEVCKHAGIDEIIEKEESKGRVKIIKKCKKYEMVSSHTARRSFCTNAYKSGMPAIDIMAISGHKTEKVFLDYIKVTEDERAIKIGRHKFFN